MNDINSVMMVGRLTRDMELKYLQSGSAVGNISVAVNRSVKRGDEWTDEASFFEATLFGKQAEGLKPYLVKGKQVAISGSLKQQRWEKDGQKNSKVVIICDSVQLLGGKGDGTPQQSQSSYSQQYEQQAKEEFKEDIPWEGDSDGISF